ncbi:hypothetical protein [Salinigranum marinum]|uniref:hypothetical protein n=1 Tax=Salinigranum marinum TaxID=1515595 RepID=UPI002989FFB9|nr:hypothetical protein [Salinigranum marinum]
MESDELGPGDAILVDTNLFVAVGGVTIRSSRNFETLLSVDNSRYWFHSESNRN